MRCFSRATHLQGDDARRHANLAVATGYVNASWTLECDLTCAYVCRLLDHLARTV